MELPLPRIQTARELWPRLAERAGLTGPRGRSIGPYDAGLIASLRDRLFPGQESDFAELLSEADLTAEALLRAFFATLQPFAEMKRDILGLLAEAGARHSSDQLRIRFNFDSNNDPLDLLLENFRSQMEVLERVLVPSLPPIDYDALWSLTRAGFEEATRFMSDWPEPTRPAGVLAWMDGYGFGASFAPLVSGWETSHGGLDMRLARVVALLNAMLRQFSLHGRTHEELQAAAYAADDDKESASGFSLRQLWIIESDYWPRAIARWLCRVHDVLARGDENQVQRICARVDEILPNFDSGGDEIEILVKSLEGVLDLPVWKHRHEVYAVWLGAQIHRALKAAGWHFRFHVKDDCLEFSFRGVHLATLVRREIEPELYWWTELRTQHSDLPSGARTEGIQPDYRVRRSPLSDKNTDLLVVEAKQHLRSNNKEFREAIEDYTHACPNAGVLLANYGPCSDTLMAKIAESTRRRSSATGYLNPSNSEAVEDFHGEINRVIDCALDNKIEHAFSNVFEVTLAWGAEPHDLDLHIFSADGKHIYYGNRDEIGAKFGIDVKSGFGPEIVTIYGGASYVIAVHKYSDQGNFSDSSAVVQILSGRRRLHVKEQLAIPQGTGRWWHVAKLDWTRSSVVPLQVRSDDPPAFDANDASSLPEVR